MCYVSIHVDYIRALKEYEQIVRDKKLMLKGIKYGYYTFAILLLITILLSGNYVLAYFPHSSAPSYYYNFENTNLYTGNGNETIYNNLNNKTIWSNDYKAVESFDYNTTYGNYYGTYSFENDVGKHMTNISMFDVSTYQQGTSDVVVVDSIDGHNSVLSMNSGSSENLDVKDNFASSHSSGIVEFWTYINNTDAGTSRFYLRDNTDIFMYVRFYYNAIRFYYNEGTTNYINTGVSTGWHHIKCVFDCTANEISGYIDGNLILDHENSSKSSIIAITQLWLYQTTSDELWIYFDAFGYSWDTNYVVGYNINPYDISSFLENDFSNLVFCNSGSINITDIDNHKNVLELYDNNNPSYVSINKDFGYNAISGILEYWFRTSDKTKQTYMISYGTEGQGFYLGMTSGSIGYYTNSLGWTALSSIDNNVWYHIRIDFDCSTHTFDFYLNNQEVGIDLDFRTTTVSNLNSIMFQTHTTTTATTFYIDAIGYYLYGLKTIYPISITDGYGGGYTGGLSDIYSNDTNVITISSKYTAGYYKTNLRLDFNDSYSGLFSYYAEVSTSITTLYVIDSDLNNYNFDGNDKVNIVNEPITTINYLSIAGSYSSPYTISIDLCNIYIYMDLYDDYEIGSNLFPYHYSTDELEINHFCFDTDESGNPISTPEYIIPFWNKEGTNNYVSLVDSIFSNGSMLEMSNIVPSISGIYKDFSLDTNYIGLNCSFRSYTQLGTSDGYFSIEIYDDSSTLITCLNFTMVYSGTNYMKYYDGSTYQILQSIEKGKDYYLYLQLSNSFGKIILNSTEYYIPLLENVNSLGNVRFRVFQDTDSSPFSSIEIGLDDIGVFSNESALAYGSYATAYYDLSISQWNNVENPFFTCNFIGNGSISVDNSGTKSTILFPYDEYNGILLLNVYKWIFDESPPTLPEEPYISSGYVKMNPRIVVISNSTFSFSDISIYGLILTDGTNDYLPEYVWNNIDGNYSYFYGGSSRMNFKFTCNESSNEYMSASFDIPDLDASYYVLGINSLYKNSSLANADFRVIFTDSSYSSVSAGITQVSYFSSLPNKMIDEISMIISDSNYNSSISGYIKDISFIYRPDLDTPISTTGIMDVLPFLILIVFVPVVIMLKWKLKMPILTPAMFLMTIFAVANNIIPLWLGFVICFSFVMYWLINRKLRD